MVQVFLLGTAQGAFAHRLSLPAEPAQHLVADLHEIPGIEEGVVSRQAGPACPQTLRLAIGADEIDTLLAPTDTGPDRLEAATAQGMERVGDGEGSAESSPGVQSSVLSNGRVERMQATWRISEAP